MKVCSSCVLGVEGMRGGDERDDDRDYLLMGFLMQVEWCIWVK